MLLLPLLDSELEMGVLIALMMTGNERNVEHMIVICIIYHEGKYSGLINLVSLCFFRKLQTTKHLIIIIALSITRLETFAQSLIVSFYHIGSVWLGWTRKKFTPLLHPPQNGRIMKHEDRVEIHSFLDFKETIWNTNLRWLRNIQTTFAANFWILS